MTEREPYQTETGLQSDPGRRAHTSVWHPTQGESICYHVITAVAEATGSDPTSLDPLSETIDPEALNRLFRPHSTGTGQSPTGSVTFRYEGRVVTVNADGQTVVSPPENDES